MNSIRETGVIHYDRTTQSESSRGSQPRAAPEQSRISARKVLVVAAVVLLILGVLAATGILRRMHAGTVLAERTNALAAPTVTVAPAKPGAPVENFVLPGNVTAFTDSPIYARTDGYLLRWYFDIGAKVKKGDLLAVIDTPELDKQVAQAEADLATAETNAGNAKVQAERYSGLVKSDAVSQMTPIPLLRRPPRPRLPSSQPRPTCSGCANCNPSRRSMRPSTEW